MSIFNKADSKEPGTGGAFFPTKLLGGFGTALAEMRARRSMVSRDPDSVIWLRRVVFKRKPVLFHFEVHLADHCNLNCKGCTHFSNLCAPALADLAEFEADMERMAGLFSRVKEIYLTGGEPLLNPKVTEFCAVARKHFPKSRICLETNGMLVMGMSEQFWLDLAAAKITLACSNYPISVPKLEISLLGKQQGVRVTWSSPKTEFFKIPIDPRGGHDAATSFGMCQGFNNRPILRDGNLYPCPYIAYSDVFRERFGLGGLQVYPTDSIGIRDDHDPYEVFEFLRNPVHWCSNCDMHKREYFRWGPTKRDLSEWTSAPPGARFTNEQR